MLKKNALTINNLTLVDYNVIFADAVNVNILDDLFELNLIDNSHINIKDKTVKRVLTHHMLDTACDYIVKNGTNTVFIFDTETLSQLEFFNYCDTAAAINTVTSIINNIHSLTGIMFYKYNDGFNQLLDNYIQKDGEIIDELTGLTSKHKPFSLHRLYKFINKHGLVDLQKKFFESYKYKLVLA